MAILFEIKGPGGKPVGIVFDDLAGKAQHVKTYVGAGKIWQDSGPAIFDYLNGVMEQRFISEGAYGGSLWQVNSPHYFFNKKRKTGKALTGQLTGALKDSLTIDRAPHAIRNITANGLDFGTSVRYAKDFNDGTSGHVAFTFNGTEYNMNGTPDHELFEFRGLRVNQNIARRVNRIAVAAIQAAFGSRLNRALV